MNLILESNIDTLIDSLGNIAYKYDGEPTIIRADEDADVDAPLIVVSILPTSIQRGRSIGNYMGPRENYNYSNFGYWDVDKIIIEAYAENTDEVDGRAISQAWIKQIEVYTKLHWNDLIESGSISKHSYSHSICFNPFIRKQYGYRLSFNINSLNTWTDEPESGAKSAVYVEMFEANGGDIEFVVK